MLNINANEDFLILKSFLNTSAFNLNEDINFSIQFMNSDIMDWLNSSSNVKMAKKAIEQNHFFEFEAMHDLNNVDGKRQLKSWNNELDECRQQGIHLAAYLTCRGVISNKTRLKLD